MMSETNQEFVSQPNFVIVTQKMIDEAGWPASFLGMTVIDGWTQPPEVSDAE